MTEVTYYRWRQEFGGLKSDQVKRLKVSTENQRLRKVIADLTLDKLILQEAARRNAVLTADLIELARRYGRYGYRKISALLRDAGWLVNDKRVERIWRREGLKLPAKQPKRGRLWLADGSSIRLRRGGASTMRANLTLPWGG